ncbi:MAG: S8 family peptidase [Candidatus Protochlamydia sp.]|nr:S8 family peptidase [Candidatus Protochlamydia sp.]
MNELKYVPTSSDPNLDPRYQYYQHIQEVIQKKPKFKTADKGLIPVVGRINDLAKWNNLSEVQPGVAIPIPNGDQWIVTGRVSFNRFEFINSQSFVLSLKVTEAIRPALKETIKEMGLSIPQGNVTSEMIKKAGKGTIVGIVDYGGDFNHSNFKTSSGRTRLLSIWDQSQGANPNSPHGYGTVFTEAQINNALSSSNPYKKLGYSVDSEEHGTHVMDIAAGSGPNPGVAPKAKLIFVNISSEADRTVEDVLNRDFGDSVRVIEAVKYIFDQAGNTPCVVNLSLGTNGGPHDGTNPVEMAFDALLQEKSNRAIVVAAANAYADKIHKSGTIAQDETIDIQWKISNFDRTHNEMEIWYSNKDELEVEIISPNNSLSTKVALGQNGGIWDNGKLFAYVAHKQDPDNGDHVVHIFQDPTYSTAGAWTIRLLGKIIKDGKYDAWIERDDNGPSSFNADDPLSTLGSISTGKKTITVASYDAHRPGQPISYFSGSGPTRKGDFKPEVSAAGHDVWAANSTTKTGLTRMSGTSMASPVVTGLVARILGIAKERNIDLDIDTIRKLVIDTARKNPPENSNEQGWDNRYGFGRVSAEALVAVSNI